MRRHLAPFILAGCLMLAVVVGSLFVLHFDPEPDAADLAVLAQVAAVSILPAAFVVGMLGGAFGRAGELEELALGIADASAEPELLDALAVRSATRAPGSGGRSTAGWSPVTVVPSTRPPSAPDPGDGVPSARQGRSATTWIADPALVGGDRTLALAMDHRRAGGRSAGGRPPARCGRRPAPRFPPADLVAADGERRRIARDLHDGPQQRIVLIGIEAQRIGRRADGPGFVRQVSGTVSEQLRLLLDDLRSLVHGIMPGTLTERGLPAAIAVLAEGIPVPVEVRIDPGIRRLPAEVESTGYFVPRTDRSQTTGRPAGSGSACGSPAAARGRRHRRRSGSAEPGFSAQPGRPRRRARPTARSARTRPGHHPAGGVRMRVIIAEDEGCPRAIARILGDEGYEVVALAGSHDDLIGKVAAHRLLREPRRWPTDIRDAGPASSTDRDGRGRQIRRAHPGTRIVVLSQDVDAAVR